MRRRPLRRNHCLVSRYSRSSLLSLTGLYIGRSKDASQRAIDILLTARKQRDILETRVRKIEDQFAAGRGTTGLHVDLERYHTQLSTVRKKIAERELELGRMSNYQLSLARNTRFFELRMAGRVLKTRLRARIIQRKMEFARIERPLRTQANGKVLRWRGVRSFH